MFETIQNQKILIIAALIGLYLFYRVFLKDSSKNAKIDDEYNKVLNSDEFKAKSQWEQNN